MTRRATTRLDALVAAIAGAFLGGEWEPTLMARRAGRALGDRRTRWLTELAHVVCRAYPNPPHDAPRALRGFVAGTGLVQQRVTDDLCEGRPALRPRRLVTAPTRMAPGGWPVPVIDSVGDLAEYLGLSTPHLRWFADVRSLERHVADEPLRQYRYRWIPSSSGARLIEAPKGTLRHIQRVLLHTILDHAPLHGAAHGFRVGHSIHDFVAPHVGASVVIKADLQAFFNSIRAGRIFGLWRRMGYPEPVAHALTGLTTNSVPSSVLRSAPTIDRPLAALLRGPHLPQGAPTSPALANVLAFHLDVRLSALAASFGATYTRYADDLAFSGPVALRRRSDALVRLTAEIVRDEGFRLNPLKTAAAGPGQRHRLGGIVINEHANIDRRAYDQLKAEIHDAVRHGPAVANRRSIPQFRAHLLGRISWVASVNPPRSERLQAVFERIDWSVEEGSKTTNA